jgi:hypothetical protein
VLTHSGRQFQTGSGGFEPGPVQAMRSVTRHISSIIGMLPRAVGPWAAHS